MTLDATRDTWSWSDFPEVMDTRQCMMILGVSDATLYELNHSLLKSVARKVGRQWRYSKAGLRRLLEGEAS
jgi:hypothetical protein